MEVEINGRSFTPDKGKYPNVYRGHQYALGVVSGKIPACKYVIGTCKRHLSDLEKYHAKKHKYWFNVEQAEKYLRLVQQFHHAEGEWENPRILYLDWQCFVWSAIQGWYSYRTNARRFRTVHMEIPRGQGKSAMASQAILFEVALNNPKGNAISCLASKKDQARIVLDSARVMALKNDSFRRKTKTKVLAHKIVHEPSFSEINALASDSNSLDGLKSVLCVIDELHSVTRDLYDVIDSGMSKRRDSLLLCITTAGKNVESVGFSQSAYAKKVCLGEIPDETFFAIIFTIDKDDDIFDENTWKKANPNWGASVDPVNFAAKAMKAKANPVDLTNFKIKHLNCWISEADAYFSQQKWDLCEDKTLKLEDFKGKNSIQGLDLASKIDITSRVLLFDDGEYLNIFDKSYCPEETIKESRNDLYAKCVSEGHLIATPGEAIHYPDIQKDLVEDSKKFRITDVAYDPWNATEFAQRMTSERINMVEYRMTTANLSEATKRLDALIRERKIRHNGSPLLRWCLGNIVCKEDPAGNVFPKKSNDKLKIDPIIALIMAIGIWMDYEEKKSVYETRPLRFL